MDNHVKSCYIRTEDDSLRNVYLPHNTAVFVGRSPETNITDTKCSRQQVRLYADYSECTVNIQQIGTRPCGLNGFKTQRGDRLVARHNDRLEILYGKHVYHIEFNPSPEEKSQKLLPQKRCYEFDLEESQEENCRKIQKSENDPVDKELIVRNEENTTSTESTYHKLISTTHTAFINTKIETKISWEQTVNRDLLIYTPANIQHSRKIAAYDMDGTLITTKSGLVFPKDCDDWQILYPSVPHKLKQLHAEGYKIVIFTNQRGLASGKTKEADFKYKIENVLRAIGVPIQVFIAVGDSIYRKPSIGMWETLEKSKNGSLTIEKINSFYIGDAAGRPKNWALGKKKDHSLVDRLMALNLDLKFQTPEEHFLGHKTAPFIMPIFNPKNIPKDRAICSPSHTNLMVKEQEVILMVGCPGSGKSHFTKCYLKDYEYINRDTLGTWQKCIEIMQQCIIHGKRVVIDNTNPNPTTRARYIDIAKKHKIPVRCFVMATSVEHSKHNNKFRKLTDSSHTKVNDMVINSYLKTYVPPTLDEGFTEIVHVNFVAKFDTKENERLYEMYLLEN